MKRTMILALLATACIVLLVPSVAFAAAPEVDVSNYTELETAINNGSDVRLIANIDAGIFTGSRLTVASGDTLNLDLNGFILSGVSSQTSSTALIYNRGTLTIEDSSVTGTGLITISANNNDGWNTYLAAVANSGSLTINSGTVQNTGGTDMSYAIDNHGGNITINGGVVETQVYRAIRMYNDGSLLIMNGGSIIGDYAGIWIQHASNSPTNISVTINGGSVYGRIAAILMDVWTNDPSLSQNGTSINISGGTLTNNHASAGTITVWEWDILHVTVDPGITISGGSLTNNAGGPNVVPWDSPTQVEFTDDSVIINGGSFSLLPTGDWVLYNIKAENPQTGDSNYTWTWIYILLGSVTLILSFLFIRKKYILSR